MKAIVLSRRNFREFDQVISFYSLSEGKLEVLARGVKKITSKNSSALEPGCLAEVEIIFGKDIKHLGSARILEFYKNIRIDLEKSLALKFVLGLFDKVVQVEEVDKSLFLLLKDWVEFLNITNVILAEPEVREKIDLLLDIFIAKFLKILGFSNGNFLENLEFKDFDKQKFDKKLHSELYKSLVYNLDLKVNDWSSDLHILAK